MVNALENTQELRTLLQQLLDAGSNEREHLVLMFLNRIENDLDEVVSKAFSNGQNNVLENQSFYGG